MTIFFSRIRSIIVMVLFVSFAFSPNETVKVTIEIHAPNTDDSTKIFITGNNAQMGNWQPDKILLNNTGNHLWYKSFSFGKGDSLEYKITLGSFDYEAADSSGKPFQNSILKVQNDTTARSKILFWKSGDTSIVGGQITGEVRYHRNVVADKVPPRDVIVWLPPGYTEDTKRRYPVLYMHDGQNIFDPHTASFKVDWQIDETADSLIRTGEIEPLIIVGIYNTALRNLEYVPSPEGDLYRDFVIKVVKPLIDKTYRTKPGRKHTAVGGASAGGTVSFLMAWENPDVFSKAICFSPAFKIDSIDCISIVQNYKGEKKEISVFIYNGGIDLEEQLQPGVDAMLEALEEKGYRQDSDYFYTKVKDAHHFEASWAKQMPTALKLFYGVN